MVSPGAHCDHGQSRASILDEAIEAVLSTVDLHVVLDRTGRLLRHHFGATRVAIHRLAPDARQAEVLLVDDPRDPAAAIGQRFPLEGSLCGEAVAAREVRVLGEIDPTRARVREEITLGQLGYGSVASFPLIFEGEVLGTLDIAHLPRVGMLDECLRSAGQIARLLAIALHNSLMVEEVRHLNRLLDRENALLKEEIQQARGPGGYVVESPLMREVLDKARLVAPSDTTVLIRGETGSGKEGLARIVHEGSRRARGPFVTVNLGALPETLVESELFGHEKGAFTGASQGRAGRFEQAAGGTIFLDEIGDAPPPVQVRLLRVLQEREVQRVGGAAPRRVDVRVITATNRPLERLVEQGAFRSDLYYRLAIFPIHVPPLRERREDIGPLTRHFVAKHAALMRRKPPAVPDEVIAALGEAGWPGNVRELENFVERALILSPGPTLLLPGRPDSARGALARPTPATARPVGAFDEEMRDLLARALAACDGRIYGPRGAAALLGLRPTTLQGKLRRYGVAPRGRA